MADDTLQMSVLFRACREVAEVAMAPLHYVELTRLAFERLAVSPAGVNWKRQIEDVREKLLEAGQLGFGYLGKPHCLAYLHEWLPQAELLNPTHYIRLGPNLKAACTATFEGLMRSPYMLIKTGASREKVSRGRARGLQIEHHIRQWFESQWPSMVLPPDNENRWEQPCDHDFRIQMDGEILDVDIAGPRADGTYGLPAGGGKKATDVHIIAGIEGNDILIYGWMPGSKFGAGFSEWATHPIGRLVFFLNCTKLGIDCNLFRNIQAERVPSTHNRQEVHHV